MRLVLVQQGMEMATLQQFDSEIEKTRNIVNEMRGKMEQSGIVLDQFAKADTKLGDVNFDIENARIADVLNQQKVMEGNIADVPGLVRVARKYGSALALDDAHALGVLGPNGDGTAAHFGMVEEVDIIAGTFSKSLASIGGFVAASESVIHYLKHHSRPLIFTASLPPANTAGVLAALRVLQDEPERRDHLWANTRRLQEGFRSLGFDIGPTQTPIVPVLIGPLEKTFLMWRRLFDAGVFTNPVAPPAVPPSQCRLRTSLMATHTFDQVDFALEQFARIGRDLGVI